MTAPLRHVQAGDPLVIPAPAYNAFVDAAQAHAQVIGDLGGGVTGSPANQLVLVRNDSGADLPRFGVLGINGPIIGTGTEGNDEEFKRRATIAGDAITAINEYAGRFVIAHEPIADGKIGRAIIRGITPALIMVGDQEHTHADTCPGEQLLGSGFTGAARILWASPDSGTSGGDDGQRLALIEIGPSDRDVFAARIIGSVPIPGRTFGWLYEWEEVRLDADPASPKFGQYTRPGDSDGSSSGSGASGPGGSSGTGGSSFSGGAVPDTWLSSAGLSERRAFNRFEAHLSIVHPQDGGIEGFVAGDACLVPGVPEACPPTRAAIPMLQPIPDDVVIEMRAERTMLCDTRFVFQAMSPIAFCDMEVPASHYG